MDVFSVNNSGIQLKLDKNIYSLEVIHKCFYWYKGKFAIDILSENNLFIISVTSLSKEWDISSIINKIRADLIDFKTREIIYNETKNIRELLIAKAFAHSEEFEITPPGNVSDSVGFNPSMI